MFLVQTMQLLCNCGDVKKMSKDYQGALEGRDKVDVFEPNNAITLRCCGNVKKMLKGY
jgi:hypothetical protein